MHLPRFSWPASFISRKAPEGFLLLLLAVLLLAACAKPPADAVRADVLVQGAEMSELEPLLQALEGRQEVSIGAWFFWEGTMRGKRVVVSLTEVGPMNASVATTLAIQRWQPRVILNQGTSGGHDPKLQVHDIVLGVRNVEFGAFKTLPARRGDGTALSRIQPTTTKLRLGSVDNRVAFREFPGSMDLAQQALQVKYPHGRVLTGAVGSAHQWNREIDRLEWLRATYSTDTEDMESAYVAAVAYAFRIPFLSFRIVSDNEFHSPDFIRETGQECAQFVRDFILALDLAKVGAVQHLPEHAAPSATPPATAAEPVSAPPAPVPAG
ncbi:MAG: 5'-methylthioadenosine/S-adenosylhomocysteine nucleosidase [Bryobacterales bacterium]|jgi:adenosylhomocysteine nucleosidase|nr:5'-methylthioadenosine/S-adenosylhomocysteine nucleosidase [Bryobacterales bacterium]